MGSWKNRKNRNIILIWIHKYLILRGSWKSWEEITRTSEWVWQWETGIDQCCENLFVKHSKVRKKKKKVGISLWWYSNCLQPSAPPPAVSSCSAEEFTSSFLPISSTSSAWGIPSWVLCGHKWLFSHFEWAKDKMPKSCSKSRKGEKKN